MATETPDIRPAAAEAGAAPVVPAAQAPRRQGPPLTVIATAALMVALDTTIVAVVALPRIQAARLLRVEPWSGSSTPTP